MKESDSDVKIELLPNLPQELLDAYTQKRLVIFIGAGISRLVGCKGWDGLAYSLIKMVCKPSMADQITNSKLDNKAKITIAYRMAKRNNKLDCFWKEFGDAIKANCDDKPDIYDTIAKLGGIYVTTNCDDLLTRHFPNSFTTDCSTKTLNENEDGDYVFCIHGHYGSGSKKEQDTLVFTVDKYLKHYAVGSDLVEFLSVVMHERTVLFLGYGLNEFEIISKAFKCGEDITTKHYLLEGYYSYQKELANAESEYYKSLGVGLIAYSKDDNDYDQQREIIERWVDQLLQKTPYLSRRVVQVENAVKEYSEENKLTVSSHIKRDDIGKPSLITVLDVIPASKDCFKWLTYLIEQQFVSIPEMDEINDNGSYSFHMIDTFLLSLLRCLRNDNLERLAIETNPINSFMLDLIDIIANGEGKSFNYYIATQLIRCSFSLRLFENKRIWALWDKWIYRASDYGTYVIEESIDYVREWSCDLQIRLLKQFFTAPEYANNSIRYTWYNKIAKLISDNTDEKVKIAITCYCFDQAASFSDRKAFMTSLDDRFQMASMDYDHAIYTVICILMDHVSDEGQSQICNHMLHNANSSFGIQLALHFAADNQYGTTKLFLSNPLMIQSSFVEFYKWVYVLLPSFSKDDFDTIYNWINQANFGYEQSNDYDREKRRKILINTYKYQLASLISKYDARFTEAADSFKKSADTSRPTPIEDKRDYYSITTIDPEKFIKEKISRSADAIAIDEIVEKSANRSGWHDTEFIYGEIFEELINNLTKNQLEEYTEYVVGRIDGKAIVFLGMMTRSDYIKKCDKEFINGIINKLYLLIIKGELDNEQRSVIGNTLIQMICHLDDNGWHYDDVFRVASGIDPRKIWETEPELNTEWDIQMNILNNNECSLYGTVIKSASNCRDNKDIYDSFKSWYTKSVKRKKHILLDLTSAFYFGYLLFFDDSWAISDVLENLKKSDDSDLAAYSICCGIRYVSEEVVGFVKVEGRIQRIVERISNGYHLYKDYERFINYLVAARYYELISKDDYKAFLELLSEEQVGYVIESAISGISSDMFDKQLQFLGYTYNCLNKYYPETSSKKIIERIWSFPILNSESWRLIDKSLKCINVEIDIWYDIYQCLRNTKRNNRYIRMTINTICNKVKSTEQIDIFRFDYILYELGKLHENDSVSILSKLIVGLSYSPEKYRKYLENPEEVITDLTDNN